MTRPMMAHRTREFEALFSRIQAGLGDVLLTGRPVYVCPASGTGFMEGAIRNAPPGAVLALVGGGFGERFARVARACGRDTHALSVPPGSLFDLNEVERELSARRYAAVTVVHCESSTGVITDVRAVTELARRYGAVCLVDAVSSAGGVELTFDAWRLDFVLTASQKALALPPGLGMAVASSEFVERARTLPDRGLYFDVVDFEEFAARNQTPATPALSLLYALDAQLANIAREGIEQRWSRHAAMRDETIDWVAATSEKLGIDLTVLAPEGARSSTLTAIVLPPGISSRLVVEATAARGFTIGTGYGSLRETTIRIGHMGDHTSDGLARCLDACEGALRQVTAGRPLGT